MITEKPVLITNTQGREEKEHGMSYFPLACYDLDVGAMPVSWHWHSDWEILQAAKGSLQIMTSSEEVILRQGEVVFLGPDCVHEIKGEKPGDILHSAAFPPRFLSSMDSVIWDKYIQPLQEVVAVTLVDSVPWQRACIQNFRACWDAVAQEPFGFEAQAREALMQLAVLLCSHLDAGSRKPTLREQRSSQRIKAMLGFIHTHYAEPLTSAQIAASATLSESECLRCFRTTIGTTPGQYLKEYRLRIAAGMLANTTEKVGDIGAACGFLDAAYFTKTFRDQMGCTPGEYRKIYLTGRGQQK